MEQKFDENTIYRNLKPTDLDGQDRIFENCQFISCDLSYADLSHFTFINCVMDNCNLSLIKITNTGLQHIDFKNCKITGVNFGDSSSFSLEVSFTKCVLDYSV